jgi:hypothetical protein
MSDSEVPMSKSTERRLGRRDAGDSAPAGNTARRWFRRRRSRLDKVLERNARWVAEARYTPPLHTEDAA